jgi:FAD/FMN-containing dehydrogenase
MNKVAQYLQEHLLGEVSVSADAREYFSTDGSVMRAVPQIIVYPRNENDVRKTARFVWQLAERGRVLPITARGLGSDQSGAAVGEGVVLSFPAHMHKILSLDPAKGDLVVQPGSSVGKVQQALYTHGRFMPVYPPNSEYATMGGALANNAVGERSVKYGTTYDYVKRLRVVLANGEAITTQRLSKRELGKKMGLSNFEGEVYRQIDALLADHKDLIASSKRAVAYNTAGYNIWDVQTKDGLDLTPLFVGSQGTLGVISEAEVETLVHLPNVTLMAGYFDAIDNMISALYDLRQMHPAMAEFVNGVALHAVLAENPNQLKGLFELDPPRYVLLIGFDDGADRSHKKQIKKGAKIIDKYGGIYKIGDDEEKGEQLQKLRHSMNTILSYAAGNSRAVPVLDDGIVPLEQYGVLLEKVEELFAPYGGGVPMWGHAGDATLHVQPVFDLAQVGDRQRMFRLMDQYYAIIVELGGSVSAMQGDGRIRAPYLAKQYGELYTVMQKIKQIFDPFNVLNPGVKVNAAPETLRKFLRSEYTLGHWHDHMPR